MKPPRQGASLVQLIVLLLIFLAVFALWWGASAWIDQNIVASAVNETDAAVRGQFGDKFGAINALFSGFAFAGIIFTIFLQRRDLAETRDAMSHERFDNTFFQLLNVHISITEKIGVIGNTGKQAFETFNEHLKSSDPDFHIFCALQKLTRDQVRKIIDEKIVSKKIYPTLDDADVTNLTESLKIGVSSFNNYLDDAMHMHEEKIKIAYTKSASQYIDHFSHYFRNLYHILKFIEESNLISIAEKNRYSRFVRSQLSDVELVSLFYNSMSPIELPGRSDMELGHPKMGKLLTRFDILQNMSPRSLIHPIHNQIYRKNNLGNGASNAN